MRVQQIIRGYGLPLLAKELIEQAARKRTYVVRVVYAVLLYAAACLFFFTTFLAASVSPLGILGHGRQIYSSLVFLQFAGVYFFMPALTCGVITLEKERGSLQLLLITRLGPWTILLEKLLSRVVLMLGFLLLSLPFLAFAYSLGGVSTGFMWMGVWMLVLATIQMGTLALACSAFFRSTVAAFVVSYAIAFLMFFGPWFAWVIFYLVCEFMGVSFDSVFRIAGQDWVTIGAFPFFGPPTFMIASFSPGGIGWKTLAGHSAIILTTSGICLWLARRFVVQRAFLPPWNFRRDLFQAVERKSVPVAPGVAGPKNATTVRNEASLPANEPIAWREVTKRSFGSLRLLLVVEIPLVLLCALLCTSDSYAVGMIFHLMVLLAWGLSVLVVSVQASSLIAGERAQQTLDVLCTTPLSGREIVLQKFRGVRQLILTLLVPFLTLFLFEAFWLKVSGRTVVPSNYVFAPLPYLASSALAVVIYLPLVAWLSLAIGLKVRSQARAMITAMGALVGWCLFPIVFVWVPLLILAETVQRGQLFYGEPIVEIVLKFLAENGSLISPAAIVFINEYGLEWLEERGYWLPIGVNFLWYGCSLFAFRQLCLWRADQWLGRSEGINSQNPSNPNSSSPVSPPEPVAVEASATAPSGTQ